MTRPWSFLRSLLVVPLILSASSHAEGQTTGIGFTIKAGPHRRSTTPVRFEVPATRFSEVVRQAAEAGPIALGVSGSSKSLVDRKSRAIAQVEKIEGSALVRVTWVLDDDLPIDSDRRFLLENTIVPGSVTPWLLLEPSPGALELKYGDRPVFRYNASPVFSPNYGPIQVRDAYIHPAYSPSGALVTGDFSPSHPHHRGFFLAYERTKTGDLTPDFWNIHFGSGKIHADGIDKPVAGPLTARFSTRHRWEAKDKATGLGLVVLRERWDVEAFAIPGAPYWLFDLTSTQQAVGRPFEVLPYRYGGMAYRGPEPFVKGVLDVLTSEGKHRKDGDQKMARWVDLTGPVADGSANYAGAMIVDHPSNPHYPNVVRIHPTTLPFFCFVPAYDRPLTIATDAPTVFRYRVMIHDGRPDPKLDEAVGRDFAEPPMVVVE